MIRKSIATKKETRQTLIDLWVTGILCALWLPVNHGLLTPWLSVWASPASGIWWWLTGLDWLLPILALVTISIAHTIGKIQKCTINYHPKQNNRVSIAGKN